MVSRMAAIIACTLHIEPDTLSEDEFCRAWGRAKYFMEAAYGVKWSA